MKKKYSKPKLEIERMNISLLVEMSNIHFGDPGQLDAKETSSFYNEEEEDIEKSCN